MQKTNRAWFFILVLFTIIASAIGNIVNKTNVIGGIILVVFLLILPFSFEWARGKDSISYYGLDFETLKRINLKNVLLIALVVFLIIATVDHVFFNLFNIILHHQNKIGVGSVAVKLAKSNVPYLGFIIFFSGTLLEELWFMGLIQYKLNSLNFLKSINPHFAIVMQSVLFGLVHFAPVYTFAGFSLPLKVWFFVYPFSIGLVNGYLNEKYKSLWPGWIIHYTNNVLATFLLAFLF